MRTCSKCRLEKPLDAFGRRPDRASGRRTVCLACTRAYGRDHYRRNISYYRAKAHRGRLLHRRRSYERLSAYLRSNPCVDCGESDIRVLQFDHLDPSQKTAEVSKVMRRGGAWEHVLREMEKCAVRCGNCHRRKTLLALRSARIDRNKFEEESGSWEFARPIIFLPGR